MVIKRLFLEAKGEGCGKDQGEPKPTALKNTEKTSLLQDAT